MYMVLVFKVLILKPQSYKFTHTMDALNLFVLVWFVLFVLTWLVWCLTDYVWSSWLHVCEILLIHVFLFTSNIQAKPENVDYWVICAWTLIYRVADLGCLFWNVFGQRNSRLIARLFFATLFWPFYIILWNSVCLTSCKLRQRNIDK